MCFPSTVASACTATSFSFTQASACGLTTATVFVFRRWLVSQAIVGPLSALLRTGFAFRIAYAIRSCFDCATSAAGAGAART